MLISCLIMLIFESVNILFIPGRLIESRSDCILINANASVNIQDNAGWTAFIWGIIILEFILILI